jgi:hypothetical protein
MVLKATIEATTFVGVLGGRYGDTGVMVGNTPDVMELELYDRPLSPTALLAVMKNLYLRPGTKSDTTIGETRPSTLNSNGAGDDTNRT